LPVPALPPDAVVITLNNFCEPGEAPPAGEICKKQITRAQFEKLVEAVNPNLPARNRRNLANLYVQVLTLANEAKKEGVENDPRFQENLQLVKLRLMAQSLERKLQEQSSEVASGEVEQYYKDNAAAFQETTVRRIYVPKQFKAPEKTPKQAEPKQEGGKKPEGEVDLKALAEKLRQRLAAGEDPDKLEQEAFKTTGQQTPPPSTVMGPRRRGGLPINHEEQIFNLQTGEVSQPMGDASGYFIYKVESRRQVPLEQVETEIRRSLQTRKLQDRMNAITQSVAAELNESYFGPAPPAPPPGAGRQVPPGVSGEGGLERPGRPPRQETAAPPPPRPAPTLQKPK